MKRSAFPITSDFFCHNRVRLRHMFGDQAPIVISANGVMQKSGDNPFPFRQDSNFWYLTGLTIEDALLVLDGDLEYIILPELDESYIAFLGDHSYSEYATISGLSDFLDSKRGWKRLERRLKQASAYATIAPPPAFLEYHYLYTNPARANLCSRIDALRPSIDRIDLRSIFASLRAIKQVPELEVMQSAIDITARALQETIERGLDQPYVNEKQIMTEYLYHAALLGATSQSYDPIVASGKNACMMHYQKNNQDIAPHDGILIDVGSEVGMYGADITRTVFFDTVSLRARKIWEAVRDTQEHIFAQLKPGVFPQDLGKEADEYIGEKLRELGLIGSVATETVREFFPHSILHFIGIDLHDVGDYGAPLAENMVVMIEPGIYVLDENIGIRIEDPVVITKTGYRLLSSDLPRDIEARTLVGKRK